MGGRGNGGSRNANSTASIEFKYDEPVLEAGRITQYSRRIFDENYRDARDIASRTDEAFDMRNLYWRDDQEVMSKQTLRGVQELINREKEAIDTDVDFGILTAEDAKKRRQALNAVQKTLNRQWNNR